MGFLAFLFFKPWLKVLVSFIVMTQCFDLAPSIIYGRVVWDYGAALLLITSIQLFLQQKKSAVNGSAVIYLISTFTGWLFFCLLFSLVVYGYPVENTLKTSRYWIIGYLSLFVFLRLYLVDSEAMGRVLKWLYVITYALLIVVVLQYLTGHQLLYGLYREYDGVPRYLPSFLPIVLTYLWYIIARFLSGKQIRFHEFIYAGVAVTVTAVTYTRGLYIAGLLSVLLILFLLFRDRTLRLTKTAASVSVVALVITAMLAGGWGGRVIGRATSGLDLLLSSDSAASKLDKDTFSGRLRLVEERYTLVLEHNPLVGYGFIHEDDVPRGLRNRLRYGSVINTPEMVEKYKHGYPYVSALYSADIGWANILVSTGLVGLSIFIIFVVVFILSYEKKRFADSPVDYWRLAFYVETIMLVLLMFNGNTFTSQIQVPVFMIAGYLYCNRFKRKAEFGSQATTLENRSRYPWLRKSPS